MKSLKLILAILGVILISMGFIIRFNPEIPKVFTEEHLHDHLIPLADSSIKIRHVPDSQYYKIKETKIYKTYPLYLEGSEPDGYYERLKTLEPEIAFDASKLETEEDWIKAGELVYDWGLGTSRLDSAEIKEWTNNHHNFNMPATEDGVIPFAKVTIREKGKLEVTGRSCNTCHTKVMPDNSILKGGQGNYPFDEIFGYNMKGFMDNPKFPDSLKKRSVRSSGLFIAPWINTGAQEFMKTISIDDFINTLNNTYGGVMHRHGTVIGSPTSIPDLYNIEHRKYLDHTGLVRNKSIEDVMLYATLNEEADRMDKYGNHTVMAQWPSENENIYSSFSRYSDEQLYALAKFLYSLKPPKNPNLFPAELLSKGEQIFMEQGCVTCHTPPYYTNNMLLPVDGFEVPKSHKEQYDIFDLSVGTDPTLALESRRGTGYYKVPSLIAVWNRQALLHDGSIHSLEDLLDPTRLEADYKTKGFKAAWRPTGAVEGHPFGLELNEGDKEALIAYIKSL